ncbi:MAG: endolytic transglycosylase MltG [Prochlorothrix sp.]
MKPVPPTSPPPDSPRKTSRSRKQAPSKRSLPWRWVVLVLLLIFGGMGWQGWRWWTWAKEPVRSSDPIEAGVPATIQLEIPVGTPSSVIGDRLHSLGIIRSATAWELWSHWLHLRQTWRTDEHTGGFQAGVYQLSPSQSLPEVAEIIWWGEVQSISITIPEGWSLEKMGQYFQGQGLFSAEAFLAAARQIPYDRFPWLPANIPHLEGYLFPDTYQLSYDSVSPEEVINLMLQQFETVAFPLLETTPSPFTLQEWVTLASIVEKEAVLPEERDRIAGVLLNRLDLEMPLQVDPTVEYGLGIQQTPDRPLTLNEVRTPSPYNTYINPGLPPTPIASPGQGSLQAILTPESNDYLYFVARYDGTHVFSRTLAEHEAAQDQIRSARELANPEAN